MAGKGNKRHGPSLKKSMSISVSPETIAWVDYWAEARGISRSMLIEKIISAARKHLEGIDK